MGRRARGRSWWMTPADRDAIERRLRAGERPRVIAAEFGCSAMTIRRVRSDLFLRRRVTDSGFRLSFEERIEISLRVARGEPNAEIARAIGRHRSTIGRELGRCQKRGLYRPDTAQRKADRLARRPKPTRLAASPGLLAEVETGLLEGWSPQQISARVAASSIRMIWGCTSVTETIYQSLYVQSRGELRRQLTAQLADGANRAVRQGDLERRGRIADMVPIPSVRRRSRTRGAGTLGGDLLMGAGPLGGRDAGRAPHPLCDARPLGNDHTTVHVIEALTDAIRRCRRTWSASDLGPGPRARRRTGASRSQTGVQVYFCDPALTVAARINENTNGLLRQYLPKGTDLAVHDQDELDAIAAH